MNIPDNYFREQVLYFVIFMDFIYTLVVPAQAGIQLEPTKSRRMERKFVLRHYRHCCSIAGLIGLVLLPLGSTILSCHSMSRPYKQNWQCI